MFPEAVRGVVFLPIRMTLETNTTYWRAMVEGVFPAAFGVLVVAGVGWFIRSVWMPTDLPTCLAQMALTALLYAIVGWFFLIRTEERGLVLSIIRSADRKAEDEKRI